MRPKEVWSKDAVLCDIFMRLGLQLAKTKLWEQYLTIAETVGPACELAEKAAKLLFLDENLKPILEELKEFYGTKQTNTKT